MKGTIILLICLAYAHGSFIATISCQTCGIACLHSKCYHIVSGRFNKQVCGPQSCALNKNYTATFGRCSYDYDGKSCSTGICLLPESKGCSSTIFGLKTCSTPAWYSISCKYCTSATPSCAKCLAYQSSNLPNSQQCLGFNCNGVQPVNISVSLCPSNLDIDGNTCQCCYAMTYQPTTRPGKCTTDYQIYSNTQFLKYAQEVYEKYVFGFLILVCLVGLIL